MATAGPQRIGPFEVAADRIDQLTVVLHRGTLLRSEVDVERTVVGDPSVCRLVPLTSREVSIVGEAPGATHVTFWFDGGQHPPLRCLVRVVPTGK